MNEDDNKSSNLNRKQKILFVLLWLLAYSTVLLLSSVGVLFGGDEPENTTLVDTTSYRTRSTVLVPSHWICGSLVEAF